MGKSDDVITALMEIFRASLIVFDLFGRQIAIDLKAQLRFGAVKVDDEPVDRMLAARQAAHWRAAPDMGNFRPSS
jgi:hypothetical protein